MSRLENSKSVVLPFFWILLISCRAFVPGYSQQTQCEASEILPEADRKYRSGRFEEVFQLLNPCLKKGFSATAQVQAYKILALTYLELDSTALAASSVRELLRINSGYEPELFALPQFKGLVTQQKLLMERVIQVTSVSKKAENLLQVPATVTVITHEDILKRGYRDLTQLLQDVPGFDVIRANGPGYLVFYQRGYRSTGNDRSILLVDGVEENDLQSDNIQFSRQYALSDIERVEIIYGPASTMYGANAFMGVINLVTRAAIENAPPAGKSVSWSGNGHVRYGSLNTKALDGRIAARTKNMAISVTGRYFTTDEMDLSIYPEWDFGARTPADYKGKLSIKGTESINRFLESAGKSPASGLYAVEYAPDGEPSSVQLTEEGRRKAAGLDNQHVFNATINGQPVGYNDFSRNWMLRTKVEFNDFTLSLSSWKTDEGAAPWYTNQSRLVSANLSRWVWLNRVLSLAYSKSLGEKFQVQNLTSYRLHELKGETNLASYRGYFNGALTLLNLLEDTKPTYTIPSYYRVSNQLRNELRVLWTPTLKIDVNSGLEVRNSLIQGNYITSMSGNPEETGLPDTTLAGGDNFRVFDLGFFSQATYNWTENLKAVVGGRIDYNRIRQNGGYGFVFNPRLSFIYSKPRLIVKAIYAEAFKDASYLQKYGTNSGRLLNNPTLEPEKVRNVEFNVHVKILQNLSGNITGYLANYSNAVGTASVTMPSGAATTQFQAMGRQRITGLQGELKYEFDKLSLWGNFTHNKPVDLSSDEKKLRVSDIAGWMFNVGGVWSPVNKVSLSLTGNYVSARRSGEGTYGSRNPVTRFSPFFLLNSAVTYENVVKNLSLQLQVANILNKEYFLPGVRLADGVSATSRFPQERRTFSLALLVRVF